MPTGYTADVQDGKIVTLRAFALQCARAFGAATTMRDDPMDKSIPLQIAPSMYHADRLSEAENALEEFRNASYPYLIKMMEKERQNGIDMVAGLNDKSELSKRRYVEMLDKVRLWHVPESHSSLRDFMKDQLEKSLEFDCHRYTPEPFPVTFEEWKSDKNQRLQHDVAYHAKEWANEVHRTGEANRWLETLRACLVDTP